MAWEQPLHLEWQGKVRTNFRVSFRVPLACDFSRFPSNEELAHRLGMLRFSFFWERQLYHHHNGLVNSKRAHPNPKAIVKCCVRIVGLCHQRLARESGKFVILNLSFSTTFRRENYTF